MFRSESPSSMMAPRGKLFRQVSTETLKVKALRQKQKAILKMLNNHYFLVIDLFDAGEFSSLRKTNGNGYSNVRTLAGKSLI